MRSGPKDNPEHRAARALQCKARQAKGADVRAIQHYLQHPSHSARLQTQCLGSSRPLHEHRACGDDGAVID